MHILVLGASGTVGSQVVQALRERNSTVSALTYRADPTRQLPPDVRSISGDLLDPQTVRSIFREVDALFLLNAVSTTETHQALMALDGARQAGVRRIVYLSVYDLERGVHLPHFGSKLAVEMAIKQSGIAYTILRPGNFFQNDLALREAILEHGVYPQPLGDVGLSRVDVRDIAEAAAIALTTSGHAGETYNLVGPDVLNGQATAEIWSDALGRPVRYGGNDLDVWERQMLPLLPAWMVFDFKLMFAHYQQHGARATAQDIARLTRILGRPPRRFADFTQEVARGWLAQG